MDVQPPKTRGNPRDESPFSWQSLHAVRRIRVLAEATDGVVPPNTALGVYRALTEVATDRCSSDFQVAVSDLGRLAGLCYRTTTKALRFLEEAGFVAVRRNTIPGTSLKDSSTYFLLSYAGSMGNECPSIGKVPAETMLPKSVRIAEEKKRRESPLPPLRELVTEWVQRAAGEFPDRDDLEGIGEKFVARYADKRDMPCYTRFRDWVLREHNPIRKVDAKGPSEPKGWRELLAKEYPESDHPGRVKYEDGPWELVPSYLRVDVLAKLRAI